MASLFLVGCGATSQSTGGNTASNSVAGREADAPATPPTTSVPANEQPPTPTPATASSLAEATGLNVHAGIRTDCQVDSDCAVVDVGNCCGSYPMCVRAGSQVDPAAVQAECGERDMAGICGFPVIDSCICDTGRCQGMQRGTGPVQ